MGVLLYSRVKEAVSIVVPYAFTINQKLNIQFSERKIVVSIFWDRKGILLVFYGTTINVTVYCDTLKRLKKRKNQRQEGESTDSWCVTPSRQRQTSCRWSHLELACFIWTGCCNSSTLLHRPGTIKYHLFNKMKEFLGEQ